jgi:hypothetical protein
LIEEAVIVDVAISFPRFKEETVIEDPTNVENCPAFRFKEEITALETYSFTTLLDVALSKYVLT